MLKNLKNLPLFQIINKLPYFAHNEYHERIIFFPSMSKIEWLRTYAMHKFIILRKTKMKYEAKIYRIISGNGFKDKGLTMNGLSRFELQALKELYESLSHKKRVDSNYQENPSEQDNFTFEKYHNFLTKINEKGGPDLKDYKLLYKCYKKIWEDTKSGLLSFNQFKRVYIAFGKKFCIDSPFYDILFKLNGYAGSSETIQIMHNDMRLKPSLYKLEQEIKGWLDFCKSSESRESIILRKKKAIEFAKQQISQNGNHQEFLIASFAGGTGQFFIDLFKEFTYEESQRIRVVSIDIDPHSAFISYKRKGKNKNVHILCRNLLSSDTYKGMNKCYDFAEASGIFDYLSDELTEKDKKDKRKSQFEHVFNLIFNTIKEECTLMFGNFLEGHPNQFYMETGNWKLLLRTPNKLESLVKKCSSFKKTRGDTLKIEKLNNTQALVFVTKGCSY